MSEIYLQMRFVSNGLEKAVNFICIVHGFHSMSQTSHLCSAAFKVSFCLVHDDIVVLGLKHKNR